MAADLRQQVKRTLATMAQSNAIPVTFGIKTMKRNRDKALPLRAGAAIVILLLSVPFLLLSWLLASTILEHERQFTEAEQVLTIFRSGLVALGSLEEMRSLSRPANLLYPEPKVSARYESAQKQAEQELQHLFAQTQPYATRSPAVAEPLQRLKETLPTLQDAGSGHSNSLLGPLDIITHYTDQTYALLATLLYAANLPEGEKSQSAEMLLLIPDTLRQVHNELGVIHTLSFPTPMSTNALSSADITLVDQALDNLIGLLDALGNQLQSLKQRSDALRTGPDHLQVVHNYLDLIEQDFIFSYAKWDEERAALEGHKAHAAINAITTALIDTTAANVRSAQTRQRKIDIASGIGLLLLYAALVYFSTLLYRARNAALHARDMAKEIIERKRRETELRQLNQLSEQLMGCHSCAEAYEVFGRSAAALFAGSHGALAVPSDDPEKLRTVAEWGDAARLAASFPLHNCQAMQQGLQQVTTPEHTAGCQHFQNPPQSNYACLPLLVQDQPLGLLWIECNDDRLGGLEGCVQLATSAGESLKLAVSNIQLREALHEQAIRDALTGLYNRRYLHDIFSRELAQACRSGQPLALALLDVDHFKQVNDRYGHDAGDQALIALAQHLRDSLRTSDICFRHGGEEFVLLLHTDQAGALTCVDHLRTHFHERGFQFGEHPECQLSFSAGVVGAPLMGDTLEQLLHRADTALYRAKAEGRNRVLMATTEA